METDVETEAKVDGIKTVAEVDGIEMVGVALAL